LGASQDLPQIIFVDDPRNNDKLLKEMWKKALETYYKDDVCVINYIDLKIPDEIEKEDGWKIYKSEYRFYATIIIP
jgi:hypothetical protein